MVYWKKAVKKRLSNAPRQSGKASGRYLGQLGQLMENTELDAITAFIAEMRLARLSVAADLAAEATKRAA
jgi:hypothetical protein